MAAQKRAEAEADLAAAAYPTPADSLKDRSVSAKGAKRQDSSSDRPNHLARARCGQIRIEAARENPPFFGQALSCQMDTIQR
jgi:hypothetical protein